MNIFGEGRKEGLTNPLTENLEGAGYDIEDIDTLKLNGIESQTGTYIEVKNNLDLNGYKIYDLADPVAAQDPVTLAYGEANFASSAAIPTTAPYDLYGAFTDEDTPIAIAIQPLTLNVPRGFSCSGVRAFLKNGATTAPYYVVDIKINGVTIPQGTGLCEWSIAGETTSSLGTFTAGNIFLALGDKLTVAMNADTTASGLKIVFYGSVSI